MNTVSIIIVIFHPVQAPVVARSNAKIRVYCWCPREQSSPRWLLVVVLPELLLDAHRRALLQLAKLPKPESKQEF